MFLTNFRKFVLQFKILKIKILKSDVIIKNYLTGNPKLNFT